MTDRSARVADSVGISWKADWRRLGQLGLYVAMAATTMREVIEWIRSCPLLGPHQELMARVLTDNEREFDNGQFQFTVSMCSQLNVIVDDGFHGIRKPEQEDHKWFTLGPHDDRVILRLGDGADILNEAVMREEMATDLILRGIRHVSILND